MLDSLVFYVESKSYKGLLGSIFNSMSDGIVVTDAKTNIVAFNRAFMSISGYSEEEIAGRPIGFMKSGLHNRQFYSEMWQKLQLCGSWSGEIWDKRKTGENYPKHLTITRIFDYDKETVLYVGVFSDISLLKAQQNEIDFLLYNDPATGLPNKASFLDKATRFLRGRDHSLSHCSILFIHLDRFRKLNDVLGQVTGEKLLRHIAAGFQKQLKAHDILAKSDTDEFVVLAENDDLLDTLEAIHKRLKNWLAKDIEVDGYRLSISASIGSSRFPEDSTNLERLLNFASLSMRHAKSNGGGHWKKYSEINSHQMLKDLQLESLIREGIHKKQFVPYYQCKIDLQSNQVIGYEALARWCLPDGSIKLPGEFIDVAERSGLIDDISSQIISRVIKDIRKLQSAGDVYFPVAVNVTSCQFQDEKFCDSIGQLLDDSKLDADYLEIEITENLVVDEFKFRKSHDAFNTLGIKVAIDDFGTGYSSLNYLKKISVDTIKIDRSFIQDMNSSTFDAGLVKTIIRLAKSLNVVTVAEGVETIEQAQALKKLNCDQAQGYLYGKPQPLMLEQNKRMFSLFSVD